MHFGIISPPVPGHLHPFGALGRELIRRGHRVSLIHMADVGERAHRERLEFLPIGRETHPAGSLPLSLARLGRLQGSAALRFTIQAVAKTTLMMLEEGPAAIQAAGISMLLVDQMEPAGGTVAEHLGIPFVTICNALALNREPGIPPPFSPWPYSESRFSRARNRLGYAIGDHFTRPISAAVAGYRLKWGLSAHRTPEDSFSPLAQISQQPDLFDFPRQRLPAHFHYVGPLRGPLPATIPFPWERLNGRPLIYASLGTLQNNRPAVFECFAKACEGLDVQLVMSHGGGLTAAEVETLPEGPVMVGYAPQAELLTRARLSLTHAGLNTVLDSLSCGVPVVAIPITYEQPAIAQRVRYTGTGESFAFNKLTVRRLREAIGRVLSSDVYERNAAAIAESYSRGGGVTAAANIVLALQ